MLFTPTKDKTGGSSGPAPAPRWERSRVERHSTLTLTNSDCKPQGTATVFPASCHPFSWHRLTTQIDTHSKLGKIPYKRVPFLAISKTCLNATCDSRYEDNSGVPRFSEYFSILGSLMGKGLQMPPPWAMAQSRKTAPATVG